MRRYRCDEWRARRRSPAWSALLPVTAPAISPRPPSSPMAASCTAASVFDSVGPDTRIGDVMTEHMLIVFGVLAGAVVLFASGRVRPDVVAILVVLALNLSGVLTIQEALAGFGQPVVVLIAAVSIVGEGLIATGVTYRLGEAVMKAGGSNEARLVALVMVLAGTVGAFMSSSAIVAMFIPVVMAIANKIGLNRKRMLMPLSVAALISGMMTLIASSPNMIVEDTLRARGLAPFGFFAWTPFWGRGARYCHRLYVDRRTQHAEQADRCRGGWGEATERLRPARVLWPYR